MRDIPLGRIAGIPISANVSVLGIAAIVVYSLAFDILPGLFPTAPLFDRLSAALACSLFFVLSILGHELGHAVLARRHGLEVDGISLWILGGVARLNRQAPDPKAEFEIAIAGPFASLVIGLGFASVALGAKSFDIAGPGPAIMAWLGIVNVLIAVSNLLPAAPLDGGRVLTSALWRRNGNAEVARLQSGRVGMVAGLVLSVTAVVAIGIMDRDLVQWSSAGIMGIFLLVAARTEVVGAAVRNRLNSTDVDSIMTMHPELVPDSTPMDRFATWAGDNNYHVAYPVVRWGHEPVGYLTPARGSVLPIAEQSWTTVADVMVPIDLVPRAWNSESVDEVLRRMERSYPLAVVHNVRDNRILGTVSQAQLHTLIARADWWGRLPSMQPRPSHTFEPAQS